MIIPSAASYLEGTLNRHQVLLTQDLIRQGFKIGLLIVPESSSQLDRVRDVFRGLATVYSADPPWLSATPRPIVGGLQKLAILRRRIFGLLAGQPRAITLRSATNHYLIEAARKALADRPWDCAVILDNEALPAERALPRELVKVAFLHDVLSVLVSRQAVLNVSRWRRAVMKWEAFRLRRFERRTLRRFDAVIAVSRQDAKHLQRVVGLAAVNVVEIPFDDRHFKPSSVAGDSDNLIFCGMMNRAPNVDAVVYFVEAIFPRIRRQLPTAQFLIVGAAAGADVMDLNRCDGVRVVGAVPDVLPHLASAAVSVVPLRSGTGVRNKILEAWAMAKPVVSTTLGAEGLAYEDGVDILIADDASAFADRCVEALRDSALRRRLGEAGRKNVTAAHRPDVVGTEYGNILRAAVEVRRRGNLPRA